MPGSLPTEPYLHAIINMSDEAIGAELPELPGRLWRVAVDTAHAPPRDIVEPARQVALATKEYQVVPRSVVVLEAHYR